MDRYGSVWFSRRRKCICRSGDSVADLGEGPGGPCPPLFLDQTETRRAEKKIVSETGPPPTYLRVWMIPPTTCYSVNISLIKGVF